MGIAERKEREKQQRRNAIIDAAERLIFEKGYENTTMDMVAEEAELSKGTLYLYFKSKEDLYLAINARGMKILEQMFRDAAREVTTGLEKIENIGKAYFKFSQEFHNYFQAMIHYEAKKPDTDMELPCWDSCETQGMRTLEVVARAVETGIEDGSIRADVDPMQVAMALWGHTTGLIQVLALKVNQLEKFNDVTLEDIINTSFKMTRNGLAG